MIENKSFCAVPFVSIMLNTDSFMRFCCIAQGPKAILRDENKKYQIGTQTIINGWNSETMRSVREAMIHGKAVEACKHCYMQENVGKKSFRQMMTNEWQTRLGVSFNAIIKEAIDNNYTLNLPPVYLDLRLGNLCNLKCRMCNPFNSSQIAKEHFPLYANNENYQQVWTKEFGPNPLHLKDDLLQFESDFLWDEIISLIQSLKKVYMTGGEPTLIENNYRFMQECITQGHNDIELFFNINCTNITDRFLNLISQFQTVRINCSLDGYDKVNDYIRFPSKWSKVSENFEKLANLPNIRLNITPVIQTYNVLDCHHMLEYADIISKKYNKNIGVDFLINNHPQYLDVTILSDNIRQIAVKNLTIYKNNSDRYNSNFLVKNSVDGVINLMNSTRHVRHVELMDDFLTMTRLLDINRNQSFLKMIPDLAEELNYE